MRRSLANSCSIDIEEPPDDWFGESIRLRSKAEDEEPEGATARRRALSAARSSLPVELLELLPGAHGDLWKGAEEGANLAGAVQPREDVRDARSSSDRS